MPLQQSPEVPFEPSPSLALHPISRNTLRGPAARDRQCLSRWSGPGFGDQGRGDDSDTGLSQYGIIRNWLAVSRLVSGRLI